jgi:hypothetical protein
MLVECFCVPEVSSPIFDRRVAYSSIFHLCTASLLSRPDAKGRDSFTAHRRANFVQIYLVVFILFLAVILSPSPAATNLTALVLVNSRSTEYRDFHSLIEPYLTEFGVPYEVRDISTERLGEDLNDRALIIVGHRGLDVRRDYLRHSDEERLMAAVKAGAGLLSFDGLLAAKRDSRQKQFYDYPTEIGLQSSDAPGAVDEGFTCSEVKIAYEANSATASESAYFIADLHPARAVQLKSSIVVPRLVVTPRVAILARCGDVPLLLATTYGRGRVVTWTSYEWTKPEVKGKLFGFDDLVWRSLVWAAKKPFVIRGMPHFLAFRVDDVAGFGMGANQHLGWMTTAVRYGLKPWVGLFIDDLEKDPAAIQKLSDLTGRGLATASVHARTWRDFFYVEEPLWEDEHGRNLLTRDLPEATVAANFREAEQFFTEHKIAKSKVILPHFYEIGTNTFEIVRRWGAEFVSTTIPPGQGYGSTVLGLGPYLVSEAPHPSNGKDPLFIADWLSVPGHPEWEHQFFDFVEEIRDVAGYEWAPSGVPVDEAIRRGVVESEREFDSLLPAVLFTHESDHLRFLTPENWERILQGVVQGLKPYNPVPVTLDYLSQYMRALHTSQLSSAQFSSEIGQGHVNLRGSSDIPTKFFVFEQAANDIEVRELEAPPFRDGTSVSWDQNAASRYPSSDGKYSEATSSHSPESTLNLGAIHLSRLLE